MRGGEEMELINTLLTTVIVSAAIGAIIGRIAAKKTFEDFEDELNDRHSR